jgi:Transglutaminase-like superfamily
VNTKRPRAFLWIDGLLIVLVLAGVVLAVLGRHFAASPMLSIALPLAAFACIAGAVYLTTRRAWAAAARVAALAIAFGLATFVTFGVASRPGAESPQAVSMQLDQATQGMQPQDYILTARAQQLPTSDAAFAYVRDNIAFESYSGILRGAQGTFQARAGNALDRAMMLAAILEANKIPVRIVTGQLSAVDAERLFARMFEAAPKGPPQTPTISADANALRDRIFARAHRDYAVILAALGNAAPAVSGTSHADAIKEIQQHAWVQAQVNGQWIDLDPSFSDSTSGHAYTTVDQTYTSPPVALMQQVTIRVTTETLKDGALTKSVALETTTPAYKIVDSPVYLTQVQPALKGIFGNKDALSPALSIGGDSFIGTPVDFDAGASVAGAASPGPVNQAVSAFGTAAPAPAPAASGSQFVAEWLEFEIAFPDGRKEITRRTIVDRAGTAWRHAATLDPSKLQDLARNSSGLLVSQTLYNMWFSAGKHDLLAYANSAQALLNGTIPSDNPGTPSFVEQVWPLAMRDLSWFVASDHVIVPSINDTAGLRFYADSPRIFVWSAGPDPAGKTGTLLLESDLRRDVLRGIAKDPSQSVALAQHKLWFGALEGALEHEMGVMPNPDPANPFVTTSSLADSGAVIVLGPGVAPPAASDPETQARLQVALATGDTLVVPKQVLTGGISGWWQISHDTGDMRAVLADDLDAGRGGFTPGGYNRGPIRGKLPGGGGPPKTYHLPEDPKYYANLKQKINGSEIGEYQDTNDIGESAAPSYGLIGAIAAAIFTWGAALFLALHD